MNPATNTRRLDLLTSPLFVASTLLLLINDFYLKAAFHNWLTGKLSDFAGLAAFTLFFCAFWPSRRLRVATAISAGFVFWKSSYSQALIDLVNVLSPLPVGRTVDWSDLIALLVVWLVVLNFRRFRVLPVQPALLRASVVVSLFAFTATTPYRPQFHENAQLHLMGTSREAEAALEGMADHFAAIYGLQCRFCDSITEGRSYTRDKNDFYFVISFDPSLGRLFFAVETGFGSPTPSTEIVSLHASLVQELRRSFPGVEIGRFDPWTVVKLTVEIGYKDPSYETYDIEYARALRVVEPFMREQNLKKSDRLPVYYLGRLYGPRDDDRELVVTADRHDWPLAIRVSSSSVKYHTRQKELAREIEKRLKEEFGAEQVWSRCLACPGNWY